jgi:hypothetical protein
MKTPRIIGMAGRMGSGKDTAGAMLSMIGYAPIAFADALRAEVYACLCGETDPPEMPCSIWENWVQSLPADVYAKPTAPWMRSVLQWWGTEYRRAQDQDYWVDKMAARIEPDSKYVLTDVRFANESALVRRLGGVVWLIERLRPQIAMHSSEKLDGITPDCIIRNDGSLHDLAAALRSAIDSCYWRHCAKRAQARHRIDIS